MASLAGHLSLGCGSFPHWVQCLLLSARLRLQQFLFCSPCCCCFLLFLGWIASSIVLLASCSCSCCCCTDSLWQIAFFAFSRSRVASNCRVFDRPRSRIPTTRRSRMRSSSMSLQSQFAASVCRAMMYWSAVSPGSCFFLLNRAHL